MWPIFPCSRITLQAENASQLLKQLYELLECHVGATKWTRGDPGLGSEILHRFMKMAHIHGTWSSSFSELRAAPELKRYRNVDTYYSYWGKLVLPQTD